MSRNILLRIGKQFRWNTRTVLHIKLMISFCVLSCHAQYHIIAQYTRTICHKLYIIKQYPCHRINISWIIHHHIISCWFMLCIPSHHNISRHVRPDFILPWFNLSLLCSHDSSCLAIIRWTIHHFEMIHWHGFQLLMDLNGRSIFTARFVIDPYW